MVLLAVSIFNVAEAQPPLHPGEAYDPPVPNMQVFGPYGELLNKTVLQSSLIPSLPETIVTNLPAEKSQAIAKIESQLAARGIAVVQDGPHFVRIFPTNLSHFLTNVPLRGAELAARAQSPNELVQKKHSVTKTSSAEMIPTGLVDFRNADLKQVIAIYTMLAKRTVLFPEFISGPNINVHTTTSITEEEAVYAVETTLALNGILVLRDGEKIVQIVPRQELTSIKANAPKAAADAKLFDPKKLPSMDGTKIVIKTKTPMEEQWDRVQKLFHEFMHSPNQQERQAGRLLELYADLADKCAAPSKTLDDVFLTFRVETPLSREELMYAIERVFALNHLSIVNVDAKTIQLGSIGAGPVTSRRVFASPPDAPPNLTPRTNQLFPLPRPAIRANTNQP